MSDASSIRSTTQQTMAVYYMKSVPIMCLLGLFIGFVTVARAQENSPKTDDTKSVLELPVWEKGDYWEYSDGIAMLVTKVVDTNDYGVKLSPEQRITHFKITLPSESAGKSDPEEENWVEKRGFFNQITVSKGKKREQIFRSKNPNAIFGKNAVRNITFLREFTIEDESSKKKENKRHYTSWRVLQNEIEITVPQGTYKNCWILLKQSDSLISSWNGYEKWWYCPEIRNYVRLEYKYGDKTTGARVLIMTNVVIPVDPKAAGVNDKNGVGQNLVGR